LVLDPRTEAALFDPQIGDPLLHRNEPELDHHLVGVGQRRILLKRQPANERRRSGIVVAEDGTEIRNLPGRQRRNRRTEQLVRFAMPRFAEEIRTYVVATSPGIVDEEQTE
jgi:hypothetical protein